MATARRQCFPSQTRRFQRKGCAKLLREIVEVDRDSLTSYKSIRVGRNQVLSTSIKPELHRQFAKAARFFEHGSTFLYSAENLRNHISSPQTPEIAVLGASNVGKSSFINALLDSTGIANVSKRPGRTALLNTYGVGPTSILPAHFLTGMAKPTHGLILVDTPGYGFSSQKRSGKAILAYINSSRSLRGAVLLLSSEKKLLCEDRWLLRVLFGSVTPFLVVLTKADKGKSRWPDFCSRLAIDVFEETQRNLSTAPNVDSSSNDAVACVYITSAKMRKPGPLGNSAGFGGVRAALLELAGVDLQWQNIQPTANRAYGGRIIPFNEIL